MKSRRIRWTAEEDAVLTHLVGEIGQRNWKALAEAFHKTTNESRSRKQIRERWTGHLDPKVDKLPWTLQEELELFEGHKELGNKWALIAQRLPGRAESAVKNHFYAILMRTVHRRKKGFEGKVPFEKHNAPAHILHDLRSKYARQLVKLTKASSAQSIPVSETIPECSQETEVKSKFQLPGVEDLEVVMHFERWGCSADWDSLKERPEEGEAGNRTAPSNASIHINFTSLH